MTAEMGYGIVLGLIAGLCMYASLRAARRTPVSVRDLAFTIHWAMWAVIVILLYAVRQF